MKGRGPRITVNVCRYHPDSLMLGVGNGETATRVLGSKCCGNWKTVKEWELTAAAAAELVNEVECLMYQDSAMGGEKDA